MIALLLALTLACADGVYDPPPAPTITVVVA